MVPSLLALVSLVTTGYAGYYLWRWTQVSRLAPLPPGPRRLPLIGNLLDIPTSKEWLTFREWHKNHGDVVYVEALGQKLVVLSSMKAVTDLLEKRSAIYSDRHFTRMLHTSDLMDFRWNLAAMQYGERWRQSRKLLHAHVHVGASVHHRSTELRAARDLVRDLLATKSEPTALPLLVRRHISGLIMEIAYGIKVGNSEAARKKYIDPAAGILAALGLGGSPGRFLVEHIPALRHLPAWAPGAGFLKLAKETRILHRRLRDDLMQAVVDDIATGHASPSIVHSMLQEVSADDNVSRELVKDIGCVIHLGGADTTISSVVSFLLAMVIHPNVQRKAQDEIDAAVGHNRLPDFSDFDRLPYVQAVILESLRWIPVTPLGLPHATSGEDHYRGWRIPKGALVFSNSHVLLHDPEVFAEPEEFKPERFLREGDKGLELNPTVRDPRDIAFGFGRRVCPGRHMAEQDLFAIIVTVLATVALTKAVDDKGQEITPEVNIAMHGLLWHPRPFPYQARVRSTQIMSLLEKHLVDDE